jgi:hypothetical protein
MAPKTPNQEPTNDRPTPGRCTTCGHGFRPLQPTHTQCRACYYQTRRTSGVLDARSGKAAAGRELPNGAWRAAAPTDTRAYKAPDRAKGRASTLRLQALASERQARDLRAAAYDLEHAHTHEARTWQNALTAYLLNTRGEVVA